MKKKIIFILLYHVLMFYVFYFSAIFYITNINDHEDFIYSRDRNDFPPYYNIYEMKTVSSGNRIINALEDYYSSNGKYPEKLECLVPIYIKKIPRTGFRIRAIHNVWSYLLGVENPKMGFRTWFIGFHIPFRYSYNEKDDSFFLNCRYHIFSELYYNSSEKKWKYANH